MDEQQGDRRRAGVMDLDPRGHGRLWKDPTLSSGSAVDLPDQNKPSPATQLKVMSF